MFHDFALSYFLLRVLRVLEVARLCRLTRFHESVAIDLRLVHYLVHQVDFLGHQLEELAPVLLSEVGIVVAFGKDLEELLELDLWPRVILLECVNGEVCEVKVALILLLHA